MLDLRFEMKCNYVEMQRNAETEDCLTNEEQF